MTKFSTDEAIMNRANAEDCWCDMDFCGQTISGHVEVVSVPCGDLATFCCVLVTCDRSQFDGRPLTFSNLPLTIEMADGRRASLTVVAVRNGETRGEIAAVGTIKKP